MGWRVQALVRRLMSLAEGTGGWCKVYWVAVRELNLSHYSMSLLQQMGFPYHSK